ncbi:MAG: DUF502 domain-containing protein [Planctomycetota bacterium]
MKRIGKTFLQGLAAILPIALTIYVVWWLGSSAESLLGPLIRRVLPDDYYVPGLGVVLGIAFVLLVGVMLRTFLLRRIWSGVEDLFERIPLVKTIYGSVRDLMSFFARGDSERDLEQVVLVRMKDPQIQLLGLLTNDDARTITKRDEEEGLVAVYLPMSYQIGGFMVLVPRDAIEPVEVGVEEALRLLVTAGLKKERAPSS